MEVSSVKSRGYWLARSFWLVRSFFCMGAAFSNFAVIMVGVVMKEALADNNSPPELLLNTTTVAPALLSLQEGLKLTDSFPIPLRRVKQPSGGGWGMVGDILVGGEDESFRVMFDPQVSSTFLFHKNMMSGQWKNEFTNNNEEAGSSHHLYQASKKKKSLIEEGVFDLKLQDGSYYKGGMMDDTMVFDRLKTHPVRFGVVDNMDEKAATLRGGSFDGIVGLGFTGFANGDSVILDTVLNPHDLGGFIDDRLFSIYISKTGDSGELRLGNTDPRLHEGKFVHHKVDLIIKKHAPTTYKQSSDDSDDISSSVDYPRDSSSASADSTRTKFHDAREEEEEMSSQGHHHHPKRLLSAQRSITPPPSSGGREYIWGLTGNVAAGKNVITTEKKVNMAFSTLVHYGLVVNARNDYLSSSFHHALLDKSGKRRVELINSGFGSAVEAAQILVPCAQRATMPQLTFKDAKDKVFAVFDGEEY